MAEVLPVWAFGRDTGLSAYDRKRTSDEELSLNKFFASLLGEGRALSAVARSLVEDVTRVRRLLRHCALNLATERPPWKIIVGQLEGLD